MTPCPTFLSSKNMQRCSWKADLASSNSTARLISTSLSVRAMDSYLLSHLLRSGGSHWKTTTPIILRRPPRLGKESVGGETGVHCAAANLPPVSFPCRSVFWHAGGACPSNGRSRCLLCPFIGSRREGGEKGPGVVGKR